MRADDGDDKPFSAWMKQTEATRYSGFRLLFLEHFEHALGDEEAAEHVHRGQGHGQRAHDLAEHPFGKAGGEHGADDDDGGNGVRHRHQRRVQRRRHGPDDVVADVDRQHEDDQVDDGVADVHSRLLFLACMCAVLFT